jgi:HK97 family phage prohead protease
MTEIATVTLEVRETATDGDRHTLEALCVPYDTPTFSVPHPGGEVFARTAFTDLLAAPQTWPKVRLTDSHIEKRRPVAKAIEFRQASDGLIGKFQFFNTPEGRGAWENVEEDTYGGLSVGFVALAEGRTASGAREVRSARLHHVSLVDEPAYKEARVLALRAATERDEELRRYFSEPFVRRLTPRIPRFTR